MPQPTFFNLPEEKRHKILELAIEEFANNDYNTASVSRIVAKAGIAKGSLYQYFTDKQDLYNYLLEMALQKKTEMLGAFQNIDSDRSFFERLQALFQTMINYEVLYPKLAKIGMRAINSDVPLPEEIMQKAKQSIQIYISELIEKGKECGEIRPDVDPYIVSFVFSSAITGMSDYLKSRKHYGFSNDDMSMDSRFKTARIEKAFMQIVSIFENGIVDSSMKEEDINA